MTVSQHIGKPISCVAVRMQRRVSLRDARRGLCAAAVAPHGRSGSRFGFCELDHKSRGQGILSPRGGSLSTRAVDFVRRDYLDRILFITESGNYRKIVRTPPCLAKLGNLHRNGGLGESSVV